MSIDKDITKLWEQTVVSIHSGNDCKLLDCYPLSRDDGIEIHGHFISGSNFWNDVERQDFLHAMQCFTQKVRT